MIFLKFSEVSLSKTIKNTSTIFLRRQKGRKQRGHVKIVLYSQFQHEGVYVVGRFPHTTKQLLDINLGVLQFNSIMILSTKG